MKYEQKYEVRQGSSGEWGIFSTQFNICIARFTQGVGEPDRYCIEKIFASVSSNIEANEGELTDDEKLKLRDILKFYRGSGNHNVACEIMDKICKVIRPLPKEVEKVSENSENKYRVGRKEGRAILEVATGKEYLIFPHGSEKACKEYCDYLNSAFSSISKDREEALIAKMTISELNERIDLLSRQRQEFVDLLANRSNPNSGKMKKGENNG